MKKARTFTEAQVVPGARVEILSEEWGGVTLGFLLVTHKSGELCLGYAFAGPRSSPPRLDQAVGAKFFCDWALFDDEHAGDLTVETAFNPADWPVPLMSETPANRRTAEAYSLALERVSVVVVDEATWLRLPYSGHASTPAASFVRKIRERRPPQLIIDSRTRLS